MINAEGFTHPSLENRSTLGDKAGPIFFRKALGMPGQISGDKGDFATAIVGSLRRATSGLPTIQLTSRPRGTVDCE